VLNGTVGEDSRSSPTTRVRRVRTTDEIVAAHSSHMTEAHNRTRFLVRPVEVAAGAMAAITGAFIGSRLGVAGTAIGAGIVSVISSVGAVVYEYWLDRTGQSVLSRLPVSREPRATHALMRPSAAARRRAALTIVLPLRLFALALAVVTGVEVLHVAHCPAQAPAPP
jgi:hypothetical protein